MIEQHFLVDGRIDHVVGRDQPQRQTILGCLDDLQRARHATGARQVLDHDRMTERLAHWIA